MPVTGFLFANDFVILCLYKPSVSKPELLLAPAPHF
jgi:hypothetical protein